MRKTTKEKQQKFTRNTNYKAQLQYG